MSAYRIYSVDELRPDGYPQAWHDVLKHEVRKDAGNRCVRCGHPYMKGAGEWSRCDKRCAHGGPFRVYDDEAPELGWGLVSADTNTYAKKWVRMGHQVEAAWRILTVHHLDGVKANCRWWNLAALCQRCHLQIQGKVQMARVWPWEHTAWFQPYVAGFYAATYLGEELTRDETVARMDELLGLERVA